MTAEVSAWELSMKRSAGTVATDPRDPDVQSQLDKWNGEIDAMAGIATSIDPNMIRCDAISGRIGDAIRPLLPQSLRDSMPPTSSSQPGQAAAQTTPSKGCEAVLFDQMHQDLDLIGKLMDEQCKLPWLDDAYFNSMAESRAAQNAPRSPRPATPPAAGAKPTPQEQADAKKLCAGLFGGAPIANNGLAVSPILRDLRAVVYIEGRKKPADVSK